MSSFFIKSGKTFTPSSKAALDLHELLPAGNYVVKITPQGVFFLEAIDSFEFKGKQYGNLIPNRDRILNTFTRRPSTTGVMLAGEKGSGKSLLAKSICMSGAEVGIPTLVINAPLCGDAFNAFVQSIGQPAILLFDEFEKVYNEEQQEEILTLLDGVFPTKKLFIITCNDKWRVDKHMRNRPGRIFYMLDFKGLDCTFIREYCNDNLNDKSHIERICAISTIFSSFNFDMLKALVEEMNRYNETPDESLAMLNVKPEFDNVKSDFSVELILNGKPLHSKRVSTTQWKGNPLMDVIMVYYNTFYTDDTYTKEVNAEDATDDTEHDSHGITFNHRHLKKIDPHNGKYFFTDEHNNSVILTKKIEQVTRYYDAF